MSILLHVDRDALHRLCASDLHCSSALTSTSRSVCNAEKLSEEGNADGQKRCRRKDQRRSVRDILDDIEAGGDAKALEYAAKFDQAIPVRDRLVARGRSKPRRRRCQNANCAEILSFSHDQRAKSFAEAQLNTVADFEIEVRSGPHCGTKGHPCVGRRVLRARRALQPHRKCDHDGHNGEGRRGVRTLLPALRPARTIGIAPAIIYAAHVCGADKILAMGGVQGVAAMTFGLFGLPKANILVGPGNQFVAEAKRILFGRVGIDMIAGPTDSLILADGSPDPMIVAADLVGQAEHGYNSPVWLVTDRSRTG